MPEIVTFARRTHHMKQQTQILAILLVKKHFRLVRHNILCLFPGDHLSMDKKSSTDIQGPAEWSKMRLAL